MPFMFRHREDYIYVKFLLQVTEGQIFTYMYTERYFSVTRGPLKVCGMNVTAYFLFPQYYSDLTTSHDISKAQRGLPGAVSFIITDYLIFSFSLGTVNIFPNFIFFNMKSSEHFLHSLLCFVLVASFLSQTGFTGSLLQYSEAALWVSMQMLAEIIGKLQPSEAVTQLFLLLWLAGFCFWMTSLCAFLPVGTRTSSATQCALVFWSLLYWKVLAVVSLVRLSECIHDTWA